MTYPKMSVDKIITYSIRLWLLNRVNSVELHLLTLYLENLLKQFNMYVEQCSLYPTHVYTFQRKLKNGKNFGRPLPVSVFMNSIKTIHTDSCLPKISLLVQLTSWPTLYDPQRLIYDKYKRSEIQYTLSKSRKTYN